MASRIERRRLLERFRKKLTVMGIMGHTQGVRRANRPPTNPEKKRNQNEVSAAAVVSPRACSLSMTGVHKSMVAVWGAGVFSTTCSCAGWAASVAGVAGCVSAFTVSLFFFSTGLADSFFTSFFGAVLAAAAAMSAAESPFPVNSNSSLVGGRHDWSSQHI